MFWISVTDQVELCAQKPYVYGGQFCSCDYSFLVNLIRTQGQYSVLLKTM